MRLETPLSIMPFPPAKYKIKAPLGKAHLAQLVKYGTHTTFAMCTFLFKIFLGKYVGAERQRDRDAKIKIWVVAILLMENFAIIMSVCPNYR